MTNTRRLPAIAPYVKGKRTIAWIRHVEDACSNTVKPKAIDVETWSNIKKVQGKKGIPRQER